MYVRKGDVRSRKRISNFLIFYLMIVVLFFANYTFSKYTEVISPETSVGIAKFNVEVNNSILGEETTFDIKLSQNSNTYNNKIAPESNGFFEIEIDPTGTETSLEYKFTFNMENLNSNIHLTKYTINNGSDLSITDNIIQGDIKLPSSGHGFTKDDLVNLKVYWEWNGEDIVNPSISNDNIEVSSVIRQKIN